MRSAERSEKARRSSTAGLSQAGSHKCSELQIRRESLVEAGWRSPKSRQPPQESTARTTSQPASAAPWLAPPAAACCSGRRRRAASAAQMRHCSRSAEPLQGPPYAAPLVVPPAPPPRAQHTVPRQLQPRARSACTAAPRFQRQAPPVRPRPAYVQVVWPQAVRVGDLNGGA